MGQKIEQLSPDDALRIEKQRTWVREHYDEDARQQYDTLEGKLALLDTIVQSGWIEPNETWKLQSLGITLGDALVQKLGMSWVAVEDQYGRGPAVRVEGTSIVLFPLTAISKRIERGEPVDVRQMFDWYCEKVVELKTKGA